jgi:hypothetical protein
MTQKPRKQMRRGTATAVAVACSAGFCVIAWKFEALPEALGSLAGCWIAQTKPVDNFFKRLKRAAMDAALYGCA